MKRCLEPHIQFEGSTAYTCDLHKKCHKHNEVQLLQGTIKMAKIKNHKHLPGRPLSPACAREGCRPGFTNLPKAAAAEGQSRCPSPALSADCPRVRPTPAHGSLGRQTGRRYHTHSTDVKMKVQR